MATSASEAREEISRRAAVAESGADWAEICRLEAEAVEIEQSFECIYCGALRPSENGTGSDVVCCGERGHVQVSA